MTVTIKRDAKVLKRLAALSVPSSLVDKAALDIFSELQRKLAFQNWPFYSMRRSRQ